MTVDPKRTVAELKELRALTADENGAQRVAWTDTWLKAREWFTTKLAGLPVEHHYDAAGNHWVTLPGESREGPAHRRPSRFRAERRLARWLPRRADRLSKFCAASPPNTTAARQSPFAWSIGPTKKARASAAACSAPPPSPAPTPSTPTAAAPTTTAFAWKTRCAAAASRSIASPKPRASRKNAAAYLELHIEQGPVLESLGLPLGVVLGTKGVERHAITFHGQEAHSGSTPMNARRDALAAAAKLALEIRTIAGKHPDAVCTMGSVKTFPGIVTAVVGRCEATLDQRDLDAAVLAAMYREAREASERFAQEEGCTVEWSRIWNIEPVPFHPDLIDFCEAGRHARSPATAHRLPSGPLHDAAEVARAGIPTVMMFVQSLGGISHNKIEDTSEEHLEMAVEAFAELAEQTAAVDSDA